MDADRNHKEVSSILNLINSRLDNLEKSVTGNNVLGYGQTNTIGTVLDPQIDQPYITEPSQTDNRLSVLTTALSIRDTSFERDLEISRPYRKATRDTVDFSFRSSVVGSHAWSALSDVSLSEISVISVIVLPIFISDISNSHHYHFGKVIDPLYEEDPPDLRSASLSTSSTQSVTPSEGSQLVSSRSSISLLPVTKVIPRNIPATEAYSLPASGASKFLREYKIVVVGGGGSGKSSLTIQVSCFSKSNQILHF